ncbi:MAG: hypothetical protein RIR79_677 [Pseudomonadota bacterium]|jgi:hypothetical protein
MIGIKNSIRVPLLLLLFNGAVGHCSTYCQPSPEPHAEVQDRLLQVAAVVKQELEQSGQSVALISRSGLSLQRFDVRYSHAGISLQHNTNGAWSVRQLYFACDENRPRIFDQGVTGFVMGANQPEGGYISMVFLPTHASQPLEAAALDNTRALQLLGTTYSANAYPFSTLYQNCNQWVIELIASAWGASQPQALRESAQQWLQTQHYQPTTLRVGWMPLMWISSWVAWLHTDDHPQEDWDAAQYRISMPQSIEAFVHQRFPQAQRVEICYTENHIRIHRGWDTELTTCD